MSTRAGKHKTLPQHLWGFLTSRKVAVVLLLAGLAMLALGLFIPQVPADLDTAGLEQWWAVAREQYGSRLDLYERLGLSHLFRTPTFLALLAALLLSTLLCTVDRLGRLWRAMTIRPAVRLPDRLYQEVEHNVSLERARQALRQPGSRLWAEAGPLAEAGQTQPDPSNPRADRDNGSGTAYYFHQETLRLAPAGTMLTHLGLFLFALAALLHTQWAWRERVLVDPEQPEERDAAHLEHGACDLWNIGFEVSGTRTGMPAGRGRLRVTQDDMTVEGWTGPAAPLSACGANLYLDSYGLALRASVSDEDGTSLQVVSPEDSAAAAAPAASAALLRFPEGVTEGGFDVPALDWHVTVAPSPEALAGFAEGQIEVRVTEGSRGRILFESTLAGPGGLDVAVAGGRLALYPDIYLVVEAVHDPGFAAFLAGGLTLALGGGLSLILPRRRLWAHLDEAGTLHVRLDARDSEAQREQIERLRTRLRRSGGGVT